MKEAAGWRSHAMKTALIASATWTVLVLILTMYRYAQTPPIEEVLSENCPQMLHQLVPSVERAIQAYDSRWGLPIVVWRDAKTGGELQMFRPGEASLHCSTLEQRGRLILERKRLGLAQPELTVNFERLAGLIVFPVLFVLAGVVVISPQRRQRDTGLGSSDRTAGRGAVAPEVEQDVSARASAEALEQALLDREREDPLVRAKIGAKEVTHHLLEAMKSDRGVHIESLLCAIGSLAGYACQASVRASANMRGIPAQKFMHTVQTADGARYFFGDLINKPLAEDRYSVWSIAAGSAQHLSQEPLPDVQEIFAHVTQSVGTEQFGRPRLPDGNQPADQPISYATSLWPVFEPVLKQLRLPPEHWPVVFGIAAGDLIEKGKGVIEPTLALRIVMESAVPMSKIDRRGEQ